MTDNNDHPETVESSYRPVIRQAATVVVMLSLFAVQPVAAQSNAVCSADNLPSMIEGFFHDDDAGNCRSRYRVAG